MFTTKRKKNYMTFIYSAIIVVLCLLITAIAWPEETTAPANAQKDRNSRYDNPSAR